MRAVAAEAAAADEAAVLGEAAQAVRQFRST